MSLDNLPVEWTKDQLANLVNFIDYRGKTPTKTSEGIPLITAKNIRDGYINREPREYIADAAYDGWMTRGIPQLGDLVITTEAPMGNVAILNIQEKFALAQRAICLNFKYNQCISKFLYYYLRSQYFKTDLQAKATGTTVQGIKAAELKKIFVPLAPLAEQQEIVRQLDLMLAQVEQIKARLDAIPAILKKFRQSVLADAVSGKLTEEWRSNQENLEEWIFSELRHFVEKPIYGTSAKSAKTGSIPVLRMGNLQDGEIDWEDLVYTSDNTEIQKNDLKLNDLLFNRTNSPELVGKTSIYRGNREAIFAGYLIRVRCLPMLDPEFLNYHLNSHIGREYCYRVKTDGVSQSNINAQKLLAYPLNCPPINEQKFIVKSVKNYLTLIGKIEKTAASAQKRVNLLTQSILAKAFSGELTAEWREQHQELITGVNSAEALLAKIQAEREVSKPVKKGKKAK